MCDLWWWGLTFDWFERIYENGSGLNLQVVVSLDLLEVRPKSSYVIVFTLSSGLMNYIAPKYLFKE